MSILIPELPLRLKNLSTMSRWVCTTANLAAPRPSNAAFIRLGDSNTKNYRSWVSGLKTRIESSNPQRMEAIARLPSNPNSHNPNPERSSKTSSRGPRTGIWLLQILHPTKKHGCTKRKGSRGQGNTKGKEEERGRTGLGGLRGKEKKPLCDGGDIQSNRRGGQYTRRAWRNASCSRWSPSTHRNIVPSCRWCRNRMPSPQRSVQQTNTIPRTTMVISVPLSRPLVLVRELGFPEP